MKKIFSLMLTVTLVAGSVFLLSGCEKDKGGNGNGEKKKNTVDISFENGKGTFTVSVPKDDEGNAKYEFTKEKPSASKKTATFYLETDKTVLAFSTSGLVYNTSKDYKAKYGETKATFDGYLEFMDDESISSRPKLAGIERFEINGRKALRYYSREGGSGDYKYYGYNYMMECDDIYPGSDVQFGVYYKTDEVLKEAKEFDDETLEIIKSLKLTATK